MMIERILALLAMLSTLTGCTGAEAASLPPEADMDAPAYVETVPHEADTPDGADTPDSVSSGADSPDSVSGGQDTPHSGDTASGLSGETADEPSIPAPAPDNSGGDGETANPAALYTRFSPYSGGGPLQPRNDYGVLLPYVGGMSQEYGYALWGLVTADGQVVTDPVYGEVKPYGPYLLLFRGGEYRSDGTRASQPELTLCGKDGSWTMDAGDFHHSILLDGVGMAVALENGDVRVIREDGTIARTFARKDLEPYLGTGYSWDDEEGREVVYVGGPIAVCRWDEDSPYGNGAAYDCFMDLSTGEITGEPPAGFAPENGWGDLDEDPVIPGYQYPDRLEDIATGQVYYWGDRDGKGDLLDNSGHVLLADFFTPGPGLWEPVIGAGLAGTIRNGAFQYVRIDSGLTVFRYPLQNWTA